MLRGFPFIGFAWLFAIAGSFGMAGFAQAEEAVGKFTREQVDFFETKIRPALVQHCYACHSAKAEELEGGLSLETRQAILDGGYSGAAVEVGQPESSLLIEALSYENEDYQMPPSGKLPEPVIQLFRQWIAMGLPDPRDGSMPPADPDAALVESHWAFQPPQPPALPALEPEYASLALNAIDALVFARQQEVPVMESGKRLLPSPAADRATWLRRVTYDLTGLPPTYEAIQRFQDDSSPHAYERVVDELLAAPQFGERWARHWLDLARYADTKGYVFTADRTYPEAYTYRDWVVAAFNRDMPYDRFLKLQIAADHFVDQMAPSDAGPNPYAAMGFLTLGRRFLNNTHDIIDDRIDVVCRTTMALTVTCARCHDHKYDPIPTADYYSLYAVFSSSKEPGGEPSPLRLEDIPNPHNVAIFVRGNPANRGEVVPRRFLKLLEGEDRQPFQHGSGRWEMAEAIASQDNPLTARVWVNRVWGKLFGRYLVDTPSDFGVRSEPPVQQELLDYLAIDLVENGWSTKRLLRQIVLSHTYRQQSGHRPDAFAVDPENNLLWKMNRRRLDFEAMRDSVLTAAGHLDLRLGGESVSITEPPFTNRRALYSHIDRQNLPSIFRTFDFATPDAHAPARPRTTVPQQALFLLNSPFMLEQAERLRSGLPDSSDPAEQVEWLYRRIMGRSPSESELAAARQFVTAIEQGPNRGPVESVWSFGYGSVDAGSGFVQSFQPLRHWTGSEWQAGPERPDPNVGWAILSATGGHPGDGPSHAVIRRWHCPVDGQVTIQGKLGHPADQGDGVRARVVTSRQGTVLDTTAQHGESPTSVSSVEVRAGDTIDFVVDCRGDQGWDSYQWRVRLSAAKQGTGERLGEWDSESGFHGPLPSPLDGWSQLAHVLLLSNEFLFLD